LAQATTIDPSAIDTAHRAVRADPSIQFDFPWKAVEPREETPQWLRAVSEALDGFFRSLGPVWQILFWVMVALVVAVLLFALVPPLREGLLLRLRRPREADAPAEWRPDHRAARALLEEAEALAAQGRFEAAVQLLLHRSIEDIERWRGGLVRPSLTARDIAGVPALPDAARGVFARLVALTERGIFARRPLAAGDWHEAREAYRAFAL
jgi:hypothetical protein